MRIKIGFLKIGDVDGVRKKALLVFINVYRASLLSPEQNFFLLMSLIDSFPAKYRTSLIEEIPNDPKIRLGSRNSVQILDSPLNKFMKSI